MRKSIEEAYRQQIISGVNTLPPDQIKFFKRVFEGHKRKDFAEMTIENVVAGISDNKLDDALGLVERSLEKMKKVI